MEIVIDISKETVEDVKNYGLYICPRSEKDLIDAIKNGKVLPEYHGRLIDADSMKTMKNIQSANFNAVELIRLWIDNQPAIIEGSDSE